MNKWSANFTYFNWFIVSEDIISITFNILPVFKIFFYSANKLEENIFSFEKCIHITFEWLFWEISLEILKEE
jgi:hypothetical protein